MYVSKKFLDEMAGAAETDRIGQEPLKYKEGNGLPADAVNDADEVNNIFDDVSTEYYYSEDVEYDEGDEQFETDDEADEAKPLLVKDLKLILSGKVKGKGASKEKKKQLADAQKANKKKKNDDKKKASAKTKTKTPPDSGNKKKKKLKKKK